MESTSTSGFRFSLPKTFFKAPWRSKDGHSKRAETNNIEKMGYSSTLERSSNIGNLVNRKLAKKSKSTVGVSRSASSSGANVTVHCSGYSQRLGTVPNLRRDSECGSDVFANSYDYVAPINKSNRSKSSSSLLKNTVRLRNHQRNVSNIEGGDLESEIESCSEAPPLRSRLPPVQNQTRSQFVLPMCEFDTSAIDRDRYDFENLDEFRQIPSIMSQSSYPDLGGGSYANHRRASFGFAPIENQQAYQQQQHPPRKLSNRVTSFEASGLSSNEEATTSSSVENHHQPVRVKVRPTQPAMARSMSSIGPTMLHRNNYGTSTPGLNNIGEPSTADVMSHTETSNSSIGTPVTHFPTSFNGGMRNSPSFQQQLKRQQMKLNLSTPTTPIVEHNPQPQTYSSSRRSSTIDYGQPETPSEMNAMVHNHNHSMPTSTPNKIAVAPLQKPRRTERDERDHSFSQKSHHHRGYDKRVMPLRSPYQCANSPSSSGSSARSPSVGARVGSPLSTPVPIDLPPSSQTPSTQELADRVRFLEHCIASSSVASPVSDMQMNATSLMFASGSSHGHQVTPTSRIHRTAQLVVSTTPTMAMSPYNLAQQQIMARDVVEKDYTIESMRRQIEQLHKQMETRQIQYDEDVNSFKRESEDARGQLLTLKSKIGDLENESKVYQDKSTRLDQTRQVAIVESQEKLLAQEKELSTLRQELAKKEQLSHDYEQMKKERDWFDKQNESLSQQLDETDAIKKSNELLMMRLQERDAQVKELEDTILAMEIKANMSLSNGGKGFFYDEDDDDISVDHLMPSGSATPVSSSNFDLTGFHRVSKSASTHQIGADCNMNNRVISNQMAQMFMGLLRKSNECKVIARCLTETAGNIADGKEPNFNRLLGCYSDVSESDSEPMIKGSASSTTNMTTAVAERYLRKNNEDLARVEQQLNELRSKFVAFYQHRCEAKQCQIQ